MKTNQSTIVTPKDRPVVNDARWLDKGVPAEAIFELCNVAATDCWINIGHTWNDELVEAYRHALETDPVASFGGIVGVNRELDGATAREIAATASVR